MIDDQATVVAVSRDGDHWFSKPQTQEILLLAGLGVHGDAHAGTIVQHRSYVATDPPQPNLRQVHLIHAELFTELAEQGFDVQPGQFGENITTRSLGLLALPCGTQLRIGPEAVVEVTGLRNPCSQINAFQPRLLNAVLGRDDNGEIVPKAGIIAIVVTGGRVMPGDGIVVRLPAEPHHALERV